MLCIRGFAADYASFLVPEKEAEGRYTDGTLVYSFLGLP